MGFAGESGVEAKWSVSAYGNLNLKKCERYEGDIPAMLTTSSQSMFDESELLWLQQSDMSFFEDYPFQTLQNMFLQKNSLRKAFLYRQKHNNHWNDKIKLIEYSFARYSRVMKHGVEEFVEFKLPFSSSTDYDFDPINAPLPQEMALLGQSSMDVLNTYRIII